MDSLCSYFFVAAVPVLSVLLSIIYAVWRCRRLKIEVAKLENSLFIYNREITKLKNTTNELQTKLSSAVAESAQKNDFYASILHEFKTPLNVIISALQLQEQKMSTNPSEYQKYESTIEAMKRNSYILLRLANSLLDVTRSELGFASLKSSNCNISRLTERIVNSVKPLAERKSIELLYRCDEKEIITSVDIEKYERIILNLLSNAIKFSPEGTQVCVSVSASEDTAFISVKDQGPGIPENMKETIFEKFKQVGSRETRAFEGSGMGLSIVKTFVELHQGSIKVLSGSEGGSEFIVQLPVKVFKEADEINSDPGRLGPQFSEILNIELSNTDFFIKKKGLAQKLQS